MCRWVYSLPVGVPWTSVHTAHFTGMRYTTTAQVSLGRFANKAVVGLKSRTRPRRDTCVFLYVDKGNGLEMVCVGYLADKQ